MSLALLQGYFGLKIKKGSLSLEPKLGKDSAKIHIYQPANNTFVAYSYSFDPSQNTLKMEFNSNQSIQGSIKLLNPWQKKSSSSDKSREAQFEVKLDGEEIPFTLMKINQDEFIRIETDFRKHTLEITEKYEEGSKQRTTSVQ